MELIIDIDKDFFELNSFMKYEAPFNELSSQENWALYLYCHPSSPKASLRKEERKDEILNHYLKNKDYDFSKIEELVPVYNKIFLTKVQRELVAWNNKIEERAIFLEKIPYSAKDAKMIDELLLNSKTIWDGYKKVYDAFQEEKIKTKTRGNQQESLFEKWS